MLIGYNTNVPYKGKQYHVQTEDNGIASPFVVTLLYCQGAILRSVKTGYAHIIGHPDFESELRKLMKHQHREMIRELITGKCEAVKGESVEKNAQPEGGSEMTDDSEGVKKQARSLDDILLEHISKKVKP
jgi:hypothetical protein